MCGFVIFLCRELIPGYLDGITGEYAPPKGYFVDEAKAEAFDATGQSPILCKLHLRVRIEQNLILWR